MARSTKSVLNVVDAKTDSLIDEIAAETVPVVSTDPVIVAEVKKSKPFIMPDFADDLDASVKDTISSKMTADMDVRFLPWDKVYSDYQFNARDADKAYTHKELDQLRISIETFGLEEALEVSLQKDGRYKVIRGHRRRGVMEWMRADDVANGVPKKDVRWNKIPVKIHEGMSYEDEVARMLDHGQRKSLNSLELFTAVKKLVELGWGETRIKKHLGESRGNIHAHFNALTLPSEVTEMYLSGLKDKKSATKISTEQIEELKKAWNADVQASKKPGGMPLAYGGGPEFKMAFSALKEKTLEGSRARNKSIGTLVEAQLAPAMKHPVLLDFINGLMGKADEAVLRDSRNNILEALRQVFPVVTQTEGNVTKIISHLDESDSDSDSDSE
jgi:ParB-like chromosome segregation protein Spo0J